MKASRKGASLAGFEDHGVFVLLWREEQVGTVTFTWRDSGVYSAKSTFELAGQTITTRVRITSNKSGAWERIVVASPLGRSVTLRNRGKAHSTFNRRKHSVDVPVDAVIHEEHSPAIFSHAIASYDRKKRRRQSFPVFVAPAIKSTLTLELQETAKKVFDGELQVVERFLYEMPGYKAVVWVDAGGRVLLIDQPSTKAAFVRQGYEGLRELAKSGPLLSQPEWPVELQPDVQIPMRDGSTLATDLFLPARQGKWPVILIRTPYNKEAEHLKARYFARRGYVVAAQDVRGRYKSKGVWDPHVHESEDAVDTIHWLASQPFSTGKIGMIGASYKAWVQWWAAIQCPPELVTIVPNVSPPDPFDITYQQGVLFLWPTLGWILLVESGALDDISGAAYQQVMKKPYDKLIRCLPVVELDKAVLGKRVEYWRNWIEHPVNDDYWQRVSFHDRLANVTIPVFHQSGWFDYDGIGTKRNYLKMASLGRPYQKLVIGPWGHTDEPQACAGGKDSGQEAAIDLRREYLRWFDYWLKGIDNGIASEPLVRLFVMGANRWIRAGAYPLPQTRWEKWYLASGGRANTSLGDGVLSRSVPVQEAEADRFRYNPGDPTPDPCSTGISVNQSRNGHPFSQHEKLVRSRDDILVYTSSSFTRPRTFVGPLSAVVYASSSAPDTDWHVRLMEVEADGKISVLAHGTVRARYRLSTKTPKLLQPGRVYRFDIDLCHIGVRIAAGSRLRVEVASAAFPTCSRNLNTGGHNEKDTRFVVAGQTVYHTRRYPSHVLLPFVPGVRSERPRRAEV
ncbi:MAG: CocE/NonD family hydrolase [Bryobacteraceae bacterium]